jgi:hypothetical protein
MGCALSVVILGSTLSVSFLIGLKSVLYPIGHFYGVSDLPFMFHFLLLLYVLFLVGPLRFVSD